MFGERRRVRRALAKAVDPERIESLLRDGAEQEPIKHGRIEFVLAFVRGETAAEVSERIARVADLAIAQGATVHDIVGALVVMTFGTHPAAPPDTGSRSSLVEVLRGQLAGGIKIVHGAADGDYGLFGGGTRISYTFVAPDFDRILGVLSRLQFGESEEFK